MKFEVRRFGIVAIPESDEDKAYIEDTLKLRREGEAVWLQRRNVYNTSGIAYLETIEVADRDLMERASRLSEALEECADELETALRANYEGMLDYPHNREKLERDLEPVYRARAALANAARQDTPS